MTHTEESLMALHDEAANFVYYRAKFQAAIREVLAERDILKIDHVAQCERATKAEQRAERAEAEVERLRKLLSDLWKCECYGWTEELADSITAALKEQP